MIIDLTRKQWSTIYTALRLERERNQGGDEDIVADLESAIDAMQAAFIDSARRV